MSVKLLNYFKKTLWGFFLCISLVLGVKVACFFIFRDNGPLPVCVAKTAVSIAKSATLYYPCTITEPIPATTLMSGYRSRHHALAWLARQIASNGFIVLGMTPIDLRGTDNAWRDVHLAGIDKLKRLNSDSDLLRGKIAVDKLQVCGHSKGGGGALLAADILGTKLKSIIAMCPWQEGFTSLGGIRTPTLIQSGRKDIYATHEMTSGEYSMLPEGISKAYFEYTSATHFSWGFLLSTGHLHPLLGSDILAWMNYYLKGDRSQQSKLSSATGKSNHVWEE